jgi:allophanate hydrolase
VTENMNEARIELVVVGAHLTGMPLNRELVDLGGELVKVTQTAPTYLLYQLPGTAPQKPGLLRVAANGAAIDVEVWSLDQRAFGAFVAAIPAPLGIGTVLLADGHSAKGFLVEAVAVKDARDVTSFGGWRNFLRHSTAA